MHKTLNILIALIWLVSGLLCKVLDFVPRHQQIVSRILGSEHASVFTKAIGVAEILLAAWILSNIRSKACTILQIILIAAMNIIEFFKAPDLLLFGKFNSVLALLLIVVIYANEFWIKTKLKPF